MKKMTKEQAYGCMYAHGIMDDEYIKEIARAILRKPSVKCLPCTCGCKRRATWFCTDTNTGERYVKLVCVKCGNSVVGKNEADAKRNWNKMIGGAENESI